MFGYKMSVVMLGVVSCTQQEQPITRNPQKTVEQVAPTGSFSKGADVSWVTRMESEGLTFTNRDGVAKECMQLLKEDCSIDAVRLRVWVNPEEGWNNADDVLVKARRAAALGLRVMVDFHFSDTWADPLHQEAPAAWASYSAAQMATAVADHVTSVLSLLKKFGVTPEWIQAGNETRAGMLYPIGNLSNGRNFTDLVNAAYDAAKAVFPDVKVIVHVDGGDYDGFSVNRYKPVFDNLRNYGGKYDIIGMSIYPENGKSADYVARFESLVNTLYATYGHPVMLCEVGMDYDQADECRSFLKGLIDKGLETGHVEGIFYWEPQAPAGYNGGYRKGCFADGMPTVALDAFKD